MDCSADDLNHSVEHREKMRRRVRVEQRRSPAQLTPRSRNQARMLKRPGKGHRHAWRREVTA